MTSFAKCNACRVCRDLASLTRDLPLQNFAVLDSKLEKYRKRRCGGYSNAVGAY
jgi:hypothetical protein